jgi:hypothetical protein
VFIDGHPPDRRFPPTYGPLESETRPGRRFSPIYGVFVSEHPPDRRFPPTWVGVEQIAGRGVAQSAV